MSIFNIHLLEHFKVPSAGAIGDLSKIGKVGNVSDLSKIGKVGTVSDVSKIGKSGSAIQVPSARAKSLEYDFARRTSLSKPKVEAPKLKVEAPKPKVEAPKLKVEDVKIYSKDIGGTIQNTTSDLAKASDTLKTTSVENMWKLTDEFGDSGKVAKQIDETGSAIPKDANGGSVVKGKAEADEISSNLKRFEENPPKDIDDATDQMKKISEERVKELDNELETGATKKDENWLSKHKKTLAAVGVATVIAGGIAIAAAVKEKEKSDKKYNIVSIEDISTSSLPLAKVTFTPGEKISNRDYLQFSDTNCEPPLPPECQIYQVDSDLQVQIIIPQKLTSNGTSGNMQIKTSFGNQYTLLLTDTTKELGNVVGDTAGAIAQGAGDVTKEVAKSFWEGLGLPDLTEYWWVLLIICILSLLSSSALLAVLVIQQ
jgi:hypothetical protein